MSKYTLLLLCAVHKLFIKCWLRAQANNLNIGFTEGSSFSVLPSGDLSPAQEIPAALWLQNMQQVRQALEQHWSHQTAVPRLFYHPWSLTEKQDIKRSASCIHWIHCFTVLANSHTLQCLSECFLTSLGSAAAFAFASSIFFKSKV